MVEAWSNRSMASGLCVVSSAIEARLNDEHDDSVPDVHTTFPMAKSEPHVARNKSSREHHRCLRAPPSQFPALQAVSYTHLTLPTILRV